MIYNLNEANRKYLILVYQFLLKYTQLKKYDELLSISEEYKIPTINNDKKDKYQILSNLNYFYVRNDLNLKALNEKELEFLDEINLDTLSINNSEVDDFIRKTFRKVMFKYDFTDVNKKYKVWYGPAESSKYMVDNDTLIIGFRYNPYVDYDLKKYENQLKYFQRDDYIDSICQELQDNISKSLGLNVKVIKYDDFSISKSDLAENTSEITH